jgi:hypothetical protein
MNDKAVTLPIQEAANCIKLEKMALCHDEKQRHVFLTALALWTACSLGQRTAATSEAS